jgi:hypothetical protein
MEEILRFLATYEVWLYALLGWIAFYYIRNFFQAWSELRLAVYGLERETAIRRLVTAVSMIFVIGMIALSIFSLVSFIAPGYPGTTIIATQTMNPIATGTTTVSPFTTPQENLMVNETPTVEGEFTGCIPGQIEWTYPQAGQEIGGIVTLKGTINLPNMGFYKYEYSQPGSDNWITIAAGNLPKNDEPLGGAWDTAQIVPGDYLLRLVVADNQNNLLPACEIPIRILPSG